jgi:hypothetical protein
METKNVKFTIEQNEKYGDFRIVLYLNGEWFNEFDNNWTKEQAEEIVKQRGIILN